MPPPRPSGEPPNVLASDAALPGEPSHGGPAIRGTQANASPAKKTVGIQTLGCRLNQFESDGILSRFQAAGFRVVPFDSGPDIAIVNTCTVTDQADARNRSAIRRATRNNPAAQVVVTGCFAQTDPAAIEALEGVSLVVGNDRKSGLFEIVEERLLRAPSRGDQRSERAAAIGSVTERPVLPVLERPFAYGSTLPVGHTRAYLKIQDGCDRKCSYCKIPQARGKGVSRPVEEILEHAARLEEAGVREIVVTGVNLGWYRGRDNMRLNGLLRLLLAQLRWSRLRISSIEPPDVNAELAELTTHPRFCDFLHVPVQSGSQDILRAMRRTYNPRSFRLRIQAALRANPALFLGTDVIVGFPGETDSHFAETLELVRELGFANIHPFRYSPRRGTAAAQRTGRPPAEVVRDRMNQLLEQKEVGWREYARRFRGSKQAVIVERADAGLARGLSGNFLKVQFAAGPDVQERPVAVGEQVSVELGEIREPGLIDARLLPAQSNPD